jgi:hypothetical protein
MNDTNNMGTGANYGKFVVDNSATMGEGRVEGGNGTMGQSKYCGCNGPMNDDPTRDTDDDKKAEPGYVAMGAIEDESQGGMY